MKQKVPAVISVFAALIWCLVASMVFVLLDGVRVRAMSFFLEDRVHLICRNVMANYQRQLYEDYGLLGVDELFSQFEENSGDVVETMLTRQLDYEKELERTNQSAHSAFFTGINLLSYSSIEITEGGYQVLSDGGGEVFLRQAASYMTAFLPEQISESLLGEYEQQKDSWQENEVGQIYTGALKALQTAKQLLEQSEMEDGSIGSLEDNVMTEAEKHRNHPVLDLVLPNQKISSACMDVKNCPSKRDLQKGTMSAKAITAQEKILGICYCSRMFSTYRSGEQEELSDGVSRSENELCYQMEYLIAGKGSDRENLAAVCGRLLTIREAVRFAQYYANPEQRAKAYGEAMTLVGFTGNPALIEAVQLGFLAAWSFEDAVKDVRLLLAGEKVSLLENVSSTKYGYEEYLKFLLFMEPAEQMAMRGLDVIENHINTGSGTGSFHVDQTITAIQGSAGTDIPWLFANLITVPVDSWKVCRKSVSWSEGYE